MRLQSGLPCGADPSSWPMVHHMIGEQAASMLTRDDKVSFVRSLETNSTHTFYKATCLQIQTVSSCASTNFRQRETVLFHGM